MSQKIMAIADGLTRLVDMIDQRCGDCPQRERRKRNGAVVAAP